MRTLLAFLLFSACIPASMIKTQTYLRTGPDTSYLIITDLQVGERVVVVEARRRWLKVKAKSLIGWVQTSCVGH